MRSLSSPLTSRILFSTALTSLGVISPAHALPQNGQVVGGSATIIQTNASQLDITQGSDRAVIDWHAFSIGAGETTNFHQPSSSSVAVNRVTGIDPSTISGRLNANGQVVLVNPNGILFDKGAQVNVGGIIASTSGITTDNAMAGRMIFDQHGSGAATIVNQGTITAAQGGLVALVAPGVANSGVITATLGKVALASGNTWSLDLYGDRLVAFGVDDQVASQLSGATSMGVGNSGTIEAAAGRVELTANVAKGIVSHAINMDGVIEASSISTEGGAIVLDGGTSGVSITGTAKANGTSGGSITVAGDSVLQQGTLQAEGTAGAGGAISITAANGYIDTAAALSDANGTARGGTIGIDGGTSLFSSGQHKATSSQGTGGTINLTADAVTLVGATVNASGATGGGTINIGGGLHGSGALRHAQTVKISPTTSLVADALASGNGGTVAVWSDQSTLFTGEASAQGSAAGGNGGQIEVSSEGTDSFGGTADASAPQGTAGSLTLDPQYITIDAVAGVLPQFQLLDPNSNVGGNFGTVTVSLANGNVVVTDPNDRIGLGPIGTGAAYLFNGTTGQLLSTLTGTSLNDHVGLSVTTLANSNYVIGSPGWNGTMGAATWGSGTAGVAGNVSALNSLTGSAVGDQVGTSITALTNGNYVVGSPNWSTGKGAATWGKGTLGVTGAVSAANSLTGSTVSIAGVGGDEVGLSITALTNGNYVIDSPNWSGNKGASTLANGTLGLTGTVSAANSLIGSLAGIAGVGGDQVGLGVTALTNGNYVVQSAAWDGGVGAATWVNGTLGLAGTITAANSLVGTLATDAVGTLVTALQDGNYVVASSSWGSNKGAVTFGNGTTGIHSTVSTANSLTGSTAGVLGVGGDQIGLGVTALTNGNYVIDSADWNGNKGAATWANGTTGLTGTISSSNSLIGSSSGDQVGLNILALTNGNYVVGSPHWGGEKGAAILGNGTLGLTGTVSSANALVGNTSGDQVGLGLTALANGNYVIDSPHWGGNKGASTFASGTLGLAGTISASNSLTGSSAGDEVGLSATALSDGNYVVGSPDWNGNKGAATWASGTAGLTGTISAGNSLIGSLAGDLVGTAIVALQNGAYIVSSPHWDGGYGAASFGVGIGLNGTVSTANSLIGAVQEITPLLQIVGNVLTNTGIVSVPGAGNGVVTIATGNPNDLKYGWDPSGAVTITPTLLTNTLNTGTAVDLQANDDITVNSAIIASAGGSGGNLTLQAGRSLIFNAGITTDNGNLTLIGNDTAANGVVNIDRSSGNAAITMNNGVAFNAGTGTIAIDLKTGAGNTYNTASGITLTNLTASAISIIDENQVTLTLNGQLTASGLGNAIVLSTGTLVNNAGATALNPTNGRYLLYSLSPLANTLDGLAGFTKHYGISYTAAAPGTITSGGNYSFYALTPTLTITASNETGTYGSALPSLAYTTSGLIDGDTVTTALSSLPQLTTSATIGSNAGSYGITFLNTLLSSLGYTVVTANGTLTIGKANLTITANNTSRLYGATNPAFTTSYTGLKNGDTSSVVTGLVETAGATSASNVGTYSIVGANAMASNYNISYVNGTLSVTPASLIISANNASRLYGATNPTFTASYNGLVNGDTSAVVSGLNLVSNATTASNAGSYTITGNGAAASNYAISYVGGTLNVTPATLTISASNASRLYGATNPAFTASYNGLVNGNSSNVVSGLTLTTAATTASNVGTYTITAANGSASNYTLSYVGGTITVTPASLTITANNAAKAYGSVNPTFTASYTGLVNSDSSAVVSGLILTTPATTSSSVGTYAITAANGMASNYAITYVAGTLTVAPYALTITANNASRVYGSTNPTFSASYSGFANGDTSSVVSGLILSASATTGSGVGLYAITGMGAMASNYAIAYVNGTLTVTPAALTISANNASRLYGSTNPAFAASYNGLVNGDTSSVVSGLSLTSNATTASNVGTYAITGAGAMATNYAISYVQGTLAITPAALTIAVNDASRLYGSTNPSFSASYTGFVNGDTAASLGGLAFSSAATSANVGSYAINASANDANYIITYQSGTLQVTPAPLTISANNASRTYGASNPTLSASYSGLVNGDTSAAVSGLALSTGATTASGVGTYAITANGGSATNYAISYLNGALAITPAGLTVSANNASRLYGSTNPTLTAAYSGLVNNDGTGVVTGLSLATNATSGSNVGTYAITGGTPTATSNYSLTFVPGALTVTPAPLTININDATRLYGAANPAFAATYNGFVNGDTAATANVQFTAPAVNANVGAYQINATGSSNYAITSLPGTLTITPAMLAVIADNMTVAPGVTPEFTASYGGLVAGDNAGTVSGVSFNSNDTGAPGTYTIQPYGGSAQNYQLFYVPGILTVGNTPASQTPGTDSGPTITALAIMPASANLSQVSAQSRQPGIVAPLYPVNSAEALAATTDNEVCLKLNNDPRRAAPLNGSRKDDTSCAAPLRLAGF
jgi:filamentous hemagglutinin family protein